jgi:hypothetical protein
MPAMKNTTGNGSRTDGISAAAVTMRSFRGASLVASALAAMVPITGLAASTAWAVTTNPTLVQIGVADLQQANSSIDGTGVTVAQVEASAGYYNPPGDPYAYMSVFEPNPTNLNQSASKFTYIDYSPTPSTFSSGQYSGHAEAVASLFYGNTGSGVATGVSGIDVYEADYYYYNVVANGIAPLGSTSAGVPTNSSPAVVNQSFIWESADASTIDEYNYGYDNYAATYNTLFVSAAGDGTTTSTTPASYVNPPATAPNGISVGALGLPNVTGADITAPGGATSYTAPLVSGVAADLIQAGREGIGGAGTQTAATDIRTVKALLFNGAVKPTGWANTSNTSGGSPLDPVYGSGIVNAYNSYENLAGGEHAASTTTTQAAGSTVQFQLDKAAIENSLVGWNLATITSSASQEAIDHYDFSMPQIGNNSYDLTATLVWNVHAGQTQMNDLNLYLLNSSGQVVGQSISSNDNLQILALNGLTPGMYDLAVMKLGGSFVTASETYALAWSIQDPAGSTPEPAALGLMAVGILGLMGKRGTLSRRP